MVYTIVKKYNYISNKYLESIIIQNETLKQTLVHHKNKINNHRKWDIAKKYANEYEFIFSFNHDGVADVVPISRSYFKLIEILQDNFVFENVNSSVKTACICEGPGGFMQAINNYATKKKINLDPIQCITLISKDRKVPSWKLQNLDNYSVCYGADGTGNIYNISNIDFFVNKVGKHSCYLVTADGGFDFSNDFNSQEKNFIVLLLCEIYICLNIQKVDGCFIVKVFDLFDTDTIMLISLLRVFYKSIRIHKPKTSRPANSEKYIICTNFDDTNIHKLDIIRENVVTGKISLYGIVDNHLFKDTLKHILKYNTTFVNNQINYIKKTLNIIEKNEFSKLQHIDTCIRWCKLYGIPIKSCWV